MEITGLNPILPMTVGEAMPKAAEIDRDVVAAIRALTRPEFLRQDRELSFTCDRGAHRIVIQIKDRKTGEVLEEIPPEQVTQILKDLRERRAAEGKQ
jgi:uncharacterized FlaG/YvyC family protein